MRFAKVCLLGLLLLVWFSCSYTKIIKQSRQVDFFEKLEAAAALCKSEIVRTDNAKFVGFVTRANSDSIFWNDFATGVQRQAATSEIKKITVLNHSKGLRGGMIAGMLLWGSIGGGLWVYYTVNPPCDSTVDDDCEESQHLLNELFFASVGAGAVLGSIHGAANGHKDVFVFNE
jgi:hypothetical protein